MRAALWGLLWTGAAFAQNAAPPQFEVASIKPAPDLVSQFTSGKTPHVGMNVDGARVDIGALSLRELICVAYKIKPFQLTAPDWITKDRWDILARIPDGVSKDQVPEMLQALLAERFKLAVRRETKDQNQYALVVGKGPLKLKESAPDSETQQPGDGTTINTGAGAMNIKADGRGGTNITGSMGNIHVTPGPDGIHYEFGKMTMAAFANTLGQIAGQPVIDMTELKGNYQVAFDIPMADVLRAAQAAGFAVGGAAPAANPGAPPVASDPSGGNVIFESVQKLGLKLEPRKAPMEMIVVDHLEKAPTEN